RLVLLAVRDLAVCDPAHARGDRRERVPQELRGRLEAAPELLGGENQELARLERDHGRRAAPTAEARDLAEELTGPDRAHALPALDPGAAPGEEDPGALGRPAPAHAPLVGDEAPPPPRAPQRFPRRDRLRRRRLVALDLALRVRLGRHRGDSARSPRAPQPKRRLGRSAGDGPASAADRPARLARDRRAPSARRSGTRARGAAAPPAAS